MKPTARRAASPAPDLVAAARPEDDLESLRERYEHLREERVRAAENLRGAETRLAELKARARERYGTDDLDALRERLERTRAENERKRAEYRAHLDRIEERLREIEDEPE